MAVIIPEVFTPLVREQFETKSKMLTFSRDLGAIDKFAEQGDEISFPKYALIGAATEMIVGTPLVPEQLAQTVEKAKIKQVGKSVLVYDYNDLTMLGNSVNEGAIQIGMQIARFFDGDIVKEANKTPMRVEGALSESILNQAMGFYGDSQDASEFECITVNSRDLTFWYNLDGFVNVGNTIMGNTNGIVSDSVVGTWRGIKIVLFDSGTYDSTLSKTRTFIIKKGSLGHKFKRDMFTETDRDILAKSTTVATDSMYAVKLLSDAGIVLIGESLPTL